MLALRYTKIMQPKYYGAAAQYNKPSGLGLGNFFKIGGIVLGAIILVTIGYFVIMSFANAGQETAATLVAREKQLVTFITTNQKDITDDNLSTVNSNLLSLATSDAYALQQGLKSSYGLTAVPEAITKQESDTTSAAKLTTAKAQAQFNKVYLELLKSKIASIKEAAQEVTTTSSGSMKTAAETTINHLTTIQQKLTQFQF